MKQAPLRWAEETLLPVVLMLVAEERFAQVSVN
jgi:hypothetical protein